MPAKQSDVCWWVTNASATDKSVEPKFVARTLVGMKIELQHMRLATTAKLKQEYELRLQRNEEACAVLLSNLQLWAGVVHGPCPESLLRPTAELLKQTKAAGEVLERLAIEYKDAGGGTGIYATECKKAVDSLRSVSFEAIREEKFHLTPVACSKIWCGTYRSNCGARWPKMIVRGGSSLDRLRRMTRRPGTKEGKRVTNRATPRCSTPVVPVNLVATPLFSNT